MIRLVYKCGRKKNAPLANNLFIVKNEHMSTTLTRTYSLRKPVRPIYDIDEEDDNQRRDSSGRKRVDVVECLLESSSTDENDDVNVNIEATTRVIWLKFDEICHIRFVLSRTSLCTDNQCSQILRGELCFRCRKRINESIFFLSFLPFNNYEICFICKHLICQQCAYSNFHLPVSKLSIPIRIQTLIKPPSVPIENKTENIKTSNTQTKTVCYDCLQVKLNLNINLLKKIYYRYSKNI